jgi:hypothetical protein
MDDVKRAVDDLRLKSVVYVVEASHDERHLLWLHHSNDARLHGWGTGRVEWSGRGGNGWMVQVGEVAGMPVAMTVMFDTICGQPVLFWTDESRVVDHEMFPPWLEANVPAYKHHHCNVANFGHCLAHLSRTPAPSSSSE